MFSFIVSCLFHFLKLQNISAVVADGGNIWILDFQMKTSEAELHDRICVLDCSRVKSLK